MPTLYLDYEGGNDNYGGTSFAVKAQAADGALTTTGTFTSATGGFTAGMVNDYLSIDNGSIYAVYRISGFTSATQLTVVQISGGTALPGSNLSAKQYYIGGRWKTITGGATAVRTIPGDTLRLIASPDPTSIGTATWTGGGRPLAIGISSSTNATPIAITTVNAHGLVTGDYVSIISHTTNTNANGVWRVGSTPSSTQFTITQMDGTNTIGNGVGGATGNATKVTNCIVKQGTATTQNIAMCGGLGQKPAWTASTNVTATQATAATFYKEGYSAASIAVAAAFTTGKAAYYTLPSTLNLSAYQQVSFWVAGTGPLTYTAAGNAYLALCSDTTGNTVVHQCPIPLLGATGVWLPVTVNLGTNLSTGINSVALYINVDEGAQTWLIDNIVACKAASAADSLTLQSLISKSDGTGDEGWYAIQSINADTIMLANVNGNSAESTNIRGYNGTTETVTTYKRETIKTIPVAAAASVAQNVAEGGTSGNVISYSGGWNRTDMSTQTGQTWFDGQNGLGAGINVGTLSFASFDRLNFCRYTTGFGFSATNFSSVASMYATACATGVIPGNSASIGNTVTNVWCNNNNVGLSITGAGHSITNVKLASNCTNNGVDFSTAASCSVQSIVTGNSLSTGLSFTTGVYNVVNSVVSTNGIVGVRFGASSQNYVNGGSTTGSTTSGVALTSNSSGLLYLNNFVVNETVETSFSQIGLGYIFSNRHDNTDGNNWIFQGGGTINQQTSVVDSPATTSWQMRPTSTSVVATSPLRLKLGTVVCAANSLVTVTARMRRDNSGLTMRLCCPGGQIVGVPNDVFGATDVVGVNAWETITLTFTPTKPGGVDIYAYAYGGTTFSGYVCNLTASQA